MKIRLSREEIEELLSTLCLQLGFCLPLPLIKRIINNPPTNVERFADVVYKGEGLDPSLRSPLYHQVHELVAKAFARHEEQPEGYLE